MVIPKDGAYLVSIIVVPCDNCHSTLQVYCQCQGKKIKKLTAYGRRISSHAEVAAGLKKNDKLILKKCWGNQIVEFTLRCLRGGAEQFLHHNDERFLVD